MTQLTDKLIAVLIPQDAYDFKLTHYKNHTVLNYSYMINGNKANVGINDGEFNVILNTCKILGKLSELSEKGCEKLVDTGCCNRSFHYKNYNKPTLSCFKTAKESLISLLQSNGVNTSNLNTLLILEKL